MHTYYAGWDGGGTKVEIICSYENKNVLLHETFGPINLNGNSKEVVLRSIQEALTAMSALPGGLSACAGLCVGAAGVSNAEMVALLTDAIRTIGYFGPLSIVGDQEIALAGAIEGDGAVLVAGTGSVCCGRRQADGLQVRTGGCGYLVDDGGSGYAIGRDILSAVVRANDGRLAPTCLTDAVSTQLGITSVPELVTWMYGPGIGKKEIASLAPLLIPAMDQQDAVALTIADKAAEEQASLVLTAWKRLGLTEGELALNGSIFKHYPYIRERLIARCLAQYPKMHIHDPLHTPAEGALSLAYTLKS